MKSEVKKASKWNIISGLFILVPMLLITLITGLLAWLGIAAQAGVVGLILVILATIFAIAFIPCLIISIGFILVGKALLKNCEIRGALKIFLVLHIVWKIIFALLCLISCIFLWVAVFVISIIYDFKVLQKHEEKP